MMAFADVTVNVTYEGIGDHHLLVHMYCRKIINQWMLLDLEELAKRSGKSIDEVLALLTKREVT